jgi:hypothetical protein
MIRLCVITICLFLGVTQTVHAVRINEVAWMGSLANANHEWIELYNAADESVSLAGWSLTDGANLNIALTGTIEGNAYAVLERTSDESAPGLALLTYSGALVNTGATLTLRDGSGNIVDQVAGGTNWQNIGGDNATKETAQYTATGWVTDIPTPGEVNRTGRAVPPVTDTGSNTPPATSTTTTTTTSSSSSGSIRSSASSVRLKNPETKMTLTPDVQSVAYVHQTIPLKVVVSGAYENQESMVRFVWNFGDMNVAEGRRVTHTYDYPGEYVVTVHAKNGKTEQVARHEIKVLPVVFSITRSESGDIQIHNNSLYDTDISGYTVKGVESVVFPPRTIILPRGTITIPVERVGRASLVALYDTKRYLVTSTYHELVPKRTYSVDTEESVTVVNIDSGTPLATTFGFFTERAAAAEPDSVTPGEVITIPAKNAAAAAAPKGESARSGYLGLIAILGLVFLMVLLSGRRKLPLEP